MMNENWLFVVFLNLKKLTSVRQRVEAYSVKCQGQAASSAQVMYLEKKDKNFNFLVSMFFKTIVFLNRKISKRFPTMKIELAIQNSMQSFVSVHF